MAISAELKLTRKQLREVQRVEGKVNSYLKKQDLSRGCVSINMAVDVGEAPEDDQVRNELIARYQKAGWSNSHFGYKNDIMYLTIAR